MKRIAVLLVGISGAVYLWGQTPPPGTISHPPPPTPLPPQPPGVSGQVGQNNGTFTNAAGTTYSVDQLAGQLRNLRSAVEQTLPLLAGFNQTLTNSGTGGTQSLAGAISGILSGVLNRNGATNTTGTAGQATPQQTNLLSVLQGVLSTNASGAPPAANPAAAQNLAALQEELQTVLSTLHNLNVEAGPPRPYYNNTTGTTSGPGGGLTPTGR